MSIEYERKYIVSGDEWRLEVTRSERIVQGYLAVTPSVAVRVRISGDVCTLNVKSRKIDGIGRIEVENFLSRDDAEQLLSNLCDGVVEKRRHFLDRDPEVWTVDVFDGKNNGLTLLEIESEKDFDMANLPSWAGAEVTTDVRYQNSSLSEKPYATWSDSARDQA